MKRIEKLRIIVLPLIAFILFGIQLNAQSIMENVKDKVETEFQKRLIKNIVSNPKFFESYVHNSTSITSANKVSEDSIIVQGKIEIVTIDIPTGVKSKGFIDVRFMGTIKHILDSYEVTSLKIYEIDVANNWKWFDLL